MASAGSVVEWRRLFNGCRAFRRTRMLTLNIDLFNLKICAILGLIIFSTIAFVKKGKTFHFSFQTWIWPFAIRVMFDKGCWWVSSKKAVAIRVVFDLACAILPRMFCCCLLAFNPKWDEVLRGRPTLCCVSVGCRLYPFHA